MKLCAILSAPFALKGTLYIVQCTICIVNFVHYYKTCASCKGYFASQCAIDRMSFAIQKLLCVGHNLPYKVHVCHA